MHRIAATGILFFIVMGAAWKLAGIWLRRLQAIAGAKSDDDEMWRYNRRNRRRH